MLQIILFFKIWGMTNDIKAIKEKYLSSENKKDSTATIHPLEGFNVDNLVVEISTGKQMRIKSITNNGKYSCYIDGGTIHVGDFDSSQIKHFNS